MQTSQRGGGGIRWARTFAAIAVILAVLGVGLWFLLRGDGLLGDGEPTPEFAFTVGRVKGLGKGGSEAQPALRRTARELAGTLDAMYSAAFVDPDKWERGSFPEVLQAFGRDAAERARQDLDELTMGPAWSELSRVQPDLGTLAVRFLLAGSGEPFAAVAVTRFEATGELVGGGTVAMAHSGTYLMRSQGGRWMIIGYEVDGRLKPRPAPAGGG